MFSQIIRFSGDDFQINHQDGMAIGRECQSAQISFFRLDFQCRTWLVLHLPSNKATGAGQSPQKLIEVDHFSRYKILFATDSLNSPYGKFLQLHSPIEHPI